MQLVDESGASIEGVGATGRMISTSGWRESSHDALREQLAALCHEQWSGWMKHLFSKSTYPDPRGAVIPGNLTERWMRQMNTPYSALSEVEQNSDRAEADRILEILGK